MAVSQVPSRRILQEVGPEIPFGGFEQVDEHELSGLRRRLREDNGAEAIHVRELGDRIASVPEAPKNVVQVNFDRNVISRYEGIVQLSEALRAELYARMSAAGINYADYARTIERPALVGSKEKLVAGQASFASLAKEYRALSVDLAEESQKYEAACRRLGLIGSPKGKEAPALKESREQLAEVLKVLIEIREVLCTKREKPNLNEAKDMHMGVIHALVNFRRPKASELASGADRRQLLAIQAAYEGIEEKLDQVRVEQLRELEELALAFRLAKESGREAELPTLEQVFKERLQGVQALFFVRRGRVDFESGASPDNLKNRYEYHLQHVWYRQIQHWVEDVKNPAEEEAYQLILDDLKPRVEFARRQAYPYGVALKNVPLEAYAVAREN